MRISLALALVFCGCEAIDDYRFFHVVGEDGGAAVDLGSPTDARTPDLAEAENLDGGPPHDMGAPPVTCRRPA